MSDMEFGLLVWAVIATVLAFKYGERERRARAAFMHLIRDEKAREKMVADWEAFKREHGAT
jgi:IS1 family transposase